MFVCIHVCTHGPYGLLYLEYSLYSFVLFLTCSTGIHAGIREVMLYGSFDSCAHFLK